MSEKTYISKDSNSRDTREKGEKMIFVNQAIKAPTIVIIDEDKNNL
jgi:hypothetical protein